MTSVPVAVVHDSSKKIANRDNSPEALCRKHYIINREKSQYFETKYFCFLLSVDKSYPE